MTFETSSIQQSMLNTFSELASVADDPEISANPASSGSDNISGSFANVLNTINQQQNDAASQMQAVETGLSHDLVGTMVATQKASLSFSALVQVRNKLISGFDDIMTMSL